MQAKTTNWGLYPAVEAERHRFRYDAECRDLLSGGPLIARGLGRSYGDASLAPRIAETPSFDRLLAFDPATGILRAEAGLSLETLLKLLVPRGWFPPVTPGTRFVTLGGAVAADVHGKNHHREGSFCRHVQRLEVMLADGIVLVCSRTQNPDLFAATCGGMGLTGVILRVDLKLTPVDTAYIREEHIPAHNLEEIMALFEASSNWTYSVAWIDGLADGLVMGRSVMMRGEHARPEELPTAWRRDPLRSRPALPLNVPCFFPPWVLNRATVSLFNHVIYARQGRKRTSFTPYDRFFYPLDAIGHWNRIYGRRGMVQYQFVLPLAAAREGLPRILKRIVRSGMGSFLAVLKLFGPQDDLISFPMEGYTLALDFPLRKGLFELLKELDRMVIDYGGRHYLAKDAVMSAEVFRRGYPRAGEFIALVQKYNPEGRLSSLQSRRLELTP